VTQAQATNRVFGADDFEVAFECVGAEATITTAVDTIQKGGTIVVVGVFGEKPWVDLGLVQDRKLNIRGTLMYQRQDYERAIELMSNGSVITALLISAHFPLDQYADACALIDRQRDKVIKVFIEVQ